MRFQINHKEVYSNRLFQDLQPQEIGLSIRNKNFIEVEEGGIIYNHADNSDYIYLLIKGRVRLKIYDSSQSANYLTKNENDFFGEIELINNSQRQSTAMAVEKSQLYTIHTEELNDLLRNKTIKANFLGIELSSWDDKQDALDEMRSHVNINIENIINSKEVIFQSVQNEMSKGNSNHTLNENKRQEFNPIENEDSIIDVIKKDIDENIIEQDSIMPNLKSQIADQPTSTSIEEPNIPVSEQTEHVSVEHYHKLKRKLAQSLYDEIKNPIRLIKSYAELLKQKSNSTEANKVLQKMIEQANIVLDSLQSEKDLTEDEFSIKPQVLYVANVLNDILLLLANYTEFRGIKLFRKYEADASVVIDKNLFYQACLQIVRFFCENIKDNGNIFVTLSRTKETIILKFKGPGSNITDDILNRLFEKSLVSNTTDLDIAKNIISKHNGTISAEKNIDGQTEISISLPIVK